MVEQSIKGVMERDGTRPHDERSVPREHFEATEQFSAHDLMQCARPQRGHTKCYLQPSRLIP
jgi:hypothetical protein